MSDHAATGQDGLPPGYQFRPEWEVTPRDVAEILADDTARDQVQLIDCRKPEEHAFASIDGFTLIPMDQIAARIDELDEDEPVIVHCHHGIRSLRVAAFLRQQGFADVKSLAGGIDAWSLAIDSAVKRY